MVGSIWAGAGGGGGLARDLISIWQSGLQPTYLQPGSEPSRTEKQRLAAIRNGKGFGSPTILTSIARLVVHHNKTKRFIPDNIPMGSENWILNILSRNIAQLKKKIGWTEPGPRAQGSVEEGPIVKQLCRLISRDNKNLKDTYECGPIST